jgi:hypothetical protein
VDGDALWGRAEVDGDALRGGTKEVDGVLLGRTEQASGVMGVSGTVEAGEAAHSRRCERREMEAVVELEDGDTSEVEAGGQWSWRTVAP